MADVGGAISGGLGLIGNIIEGNSAEKAADTQVKAADQATAEQRRQFDLTRKDLAPWQQAGEEALARLQMALGLGNKPASSAQALASYQAVLKNYQALIAKKAPTAQIQAAHDAVSKAGQVYRAALEQERNPTVGFGDLTRDFTGADLANEPGYQFRFNEGLRAINSMAANRGSLDSGATLKALTRFGQDYAGNEYQNAFNRDAANKERKYNMLAGISGTGQTTATQVGQFGANTADRVAENYLGAGNARAAGQVAKGAGWANTLNDIGTYYRLQNLLRR